LFYGTRHRKGLIEFRKVQRRTAVAQTVVRYEARAARRENRTGQIDLFRAAGLDEPPTDDLEHQRELEAARVALGAFLNSIGAIRFEHVADHLLENYEVTESEVKTLINAERSAGRLQVDGMRPRERLPKDGHVIRVLA
jgi:hypothetical protein